jgi:hypothetical protein
MSDILFVATLLLAYASVGGYVVEASVETSRNDQQPLSGGGTAGEGRE